MGFNFRVCGVTLVGHMAGPGGPGHARSACNSLFVGILGGQRVSLSVGKALSLDATPKPED